MGRAPGHSHAAAHPAPALPPPDLHQAIAAVLQRDASAIAAVAGRGVTRLADLDGKTYASYAARYEGRIVQALVRGDGGRGEFAEVVPPREHVFDWLLAGKADATWVFVPWEGVLAGEGGVGGWGGRWERGGLGVEWERRGAGVRGRGTPTHQLDPRPPNPPHPHCRVHGRQADPISPARLDCAVLLLPRPAGARGRGASGHRFIGHEDVSLVSRRGSGWAS